MAVYIAQIGGPEGPIKIGYSANAYNRMNGLSSFYKQDVTLLVVLNGTPEREGGLHERFAELRIGNYGEIFRPEPALLDYIDGIKLKKPFLRKYKTREEAKRGTSIMTADRIALVGDHLNGRNGRPKLSGPKIAKKLGVSTASVYAYWRQSGKGRFVRRYPAK